MMKTQDKGSRPKTAIKASEQQQLLIDFKAQLKKNVEKDKDKEKKIRPKSAIPKVKKSMIDDEKQTMSPMKKILEEKKAKQTSP